MVGFVNQDESQETNPSSKLKNPVTDSTWCDNLDFLDQYVPEIQDFSLPVNSSLQDFDSIKDWIEEMQDSDAEKCSETVTSNEGHCHMPAEGPSVEENLSLEKLPIGDTQLQKLQEIPTNEDNQSPLNCITGEGNLLTVEIKEELVAVDGSDDAEKLLGLNSVVEEGLGKVTLVDEVEFNPVNAMIADKVEEAESDESSASESESDESSASESESESSSDSSSSSSSSSSEDEDDDEDEDDAVEEEEKKDVVKEELEEGEIMETDAHSKDSFSKGGASGEIIMDDDGEDVVVGPIMSKNELKVLPPVPPVDVTLQPSHQMLPVGIVNSILGAQVIVEGVEKHNPLNEGSILWITEKRCALGIVDEIFGPVKNPYYKVRYNSESEVPEGIHEGSLVSFVPEFADHVLNSNKNLYQKGYDASGNDDEEVEEAEFSDDEQEAEYKRMTKMSKRGNKGDVRPVGYKKSLIRKDNVRPNRTVQFQSPPRHPNHNVQQHGLGPPGFPQSGFRPGFSGMPFQMQNQAWAPPPPPPPPQHPMMNMGPPFPPPYPPGSMVPNQVQMSMALQAQLAQLSMLSGMLLAGQQQQQQGGPPTMNPPPQFNQGAAAPFQARAAAPFQGRGGRFQGRGGRRGGGGRARGRSFHSR